MSVFRSRTTMMFVFLFVLAGFLVPAQVVKAVDDPYTGEPPDFRMHLMPTGVPNPNPNPHVFIPRPRVPQPVPLPIVVTSSNTRTPADESAQQNKPSTKNDANVLAASGDACLDFEGLGDWGSNTNNYKIWDDQFAGWGPFAVDNGSPNEIENVVFAREQSIKSGQYSFKIASMMPYAAGLASPTIKVNKGEVVTVKVSYYIFNNGQAPRDWTSMGVKDVSAYCGDGCYVNGYTHGRWDTLSSTMTATTSSGIMVLLQGESPQRLNSNIYFDNLEIRVNGEVRKPCKLDAK